MSRGKMSAKTTVLLPRWAYERIKETVARGEYFSINEFIRRVTAEFLDGGEYCQAASPGGGGVVVSVSLPLDLYNRAKELVKAGLYGTVGAVVRAAVAKKLGGECTQPLQRFTRRRGFLTWRCGRVDFVGDWAELRKAVECALKYIAAGARGRVITVNTVKLAKTLGLTDGGPVPPAYGAAMLMAVEEVADGCINGHVKRASNGGKRHTIVIDALCIKNKLFGKK